MRNLQRRKRDRVHIVSMLQPKLQHARATRIRVDVHESIQWSDCCPVSMAWNRTLLAGPLLSEIEARFPILGYFNPAKELKIVHRAFWKFALWPRVTGKPRSD